MTNHLLQIKNWLLSQSPEIIDFDEDFNIVENGVIDSLQFLELIYLIEDLSGHNVDMSRVSVCDFLTLNIIEAVFFKK